jgi:ABC-type antimicrobial peptide transport system permease subunit
VKRRRRIRAAIIWTGISITVCLLFLWVASAWYIIEFSLYPTVYAYFHAGMLVVTWDNLWSIVPMECDFGIRRYSGGFFWWFVYSTKPPGAAFCIPVWFLILVIGVPTLLLWRSDRRRRLADAVSNCSKCGYSLTGLPEGRACPECGTRSS